MPPRPEKIALIARRAGQSSEKKRLTKLSDAFLVCSEIFISAKDAYTWLDKRNRYLTSIEEIDVIYPYVHQWVLGNLPDDKQRSLVVTSYRASEDEEEDEDYGERTKKGRRIRTISDDSKARSFTVDGHRIRTWVQEPQAMTSPKKDSPYEFVKPDKIYFSARTRAGQLAVHEALDQIAREFRLKRRPQVNIANSYSSWTGRPDLPMRPLESVILPAGVMESVTEEIQDFLDSENLYVSRGMPWHRGYLFYGPPGTGKTSLARGLASHFRMDLWFASLSDLTRDGALIQLVSGIPPRSILLLEDIDVLSASHSREGKPNEVSLAGLLNTLDGVATPHGLLLFMTSNHADILDPALVRPGRIDRAVKIDQLTQEQAQRMFSRFYGTEATGNLDITGFTAADLYESFKRNMKEPSAIKLIERRQR